MENISFWDVIGVLLFLAVLGAVMGALAGMGAAKSDPDGEKRKEVRRASRNFVSTVKAAAKKDAARVIKFFRRR